jgi:hypothetical protein
MIPGLPPDIEAVQAAGHTVLPKLYTRAPVGTKWILLKTVDATVTYGPAGEFPGRTLDATVLLETDGYVNVTESADDGFVDWLHAPLSPFGSWVKAEQVITRPDGYTFLVPWGVYRVDELTIDELTGSVRISGTDATQQLLDRPLVTLGQGRVKSTDMFKARMTTMIQQVFTGNIRPFWTSLLDLGTNVDRAYGGKGIQFEDDRMAALTALGSRLTPGWRLIAPRSGPLLSLINPGEGDRGVARVSAGKNLVFAEFDDLVEREGMFNEVVVTYSRTDNVTGGRVRTQQKRIVAQYTDVGEELAVGGPFGYVTREAVSLEIPTGTADPDDYAEEQAYLAIGRAMYLSREITCSCGPIYGLEQGDQVMLRIARSHVQQKTTLVGATIPLHAGGGPWQLTLRMVKTLDPAWKPKYYESVDETEYANDFEWVDFSPAGVTIDLNDGRGDGTGKHNNVNRKWRGWTVDGASKTKGGTTLTATSSGGDVTFRTTEAWTENAGEHRYKGSASITAPKGSIKARVGLDTDAQGVIWGDWKTFKTGKTQTVTVDTGIKINPAAVRFRLRIDTNGMSGSEQVRLNSAHVEKAVRNKT